MPKIETRFALGQLAYYLVGAGMITRVRVTAWHAAQRGRTVTYTVRAKNEELNDVLDSDLFHTFEAAEASFQEDCRSHIAAHQYEINMWDELLNLDCQLTDASIEVDDESKRTT